MYGAMTAASAMLSGSDVLWSEDLQHDMAVDDRLHIVNPFHQS
jgi:predicted nucleic acid-binding protein